ncbi:MAG: type II toxin-antitoxin system VapC family toxin [Rhodoferax sp.]|uniref:type II toxin-antitoxin system VapC family toxin n=1 Tax=Rhodoferax sp. TaxID=50421 RepID=UPI0013FF1374|nr:type II toxin-antitoxin system VapC family toxin [Rhodoferax sp.]NDP37522.1 type II toxin-antitoxin system VapC family toxin [Rhodoferax sp.]
MSAETYLLDTNVISHLMAKPEGVVAQRYAARLLADQPCQMITSVVVQCELLFGLTKKPSPRLQAAYDIQMASMSVLPLDDTVPAHYATIRAHLERQGTPIGPNDTLIAAHALALDATLVSGDAEFARVPGLRVENWLTFAT